MGGKFSMISRVSVSVNGPCVHQRVDRLNVHSLCRWTLFYKFRRHRLSVGLPFSFREALLFVPVWGVCVCVCLYRYNSLRGWLPFSWVSLSDNQKGPKISCWRILPDCKNMRGSRERTNEKRIKHLFVRLSRPSFLFFPDACCVHTRFHHSCFLHHMDRDDDSSTPPPSPYPKYVSSCIRILI